MSALYHMMTRSRMDYIQVYHICREKVGSSKINMLRYIRARCYNQTLLSC